MKDNAHNLNTNISNLKEQLKLVKQELNQAAQRLSDTLEQEDASISRTNIAANELNKRASLIAKKETQLDKLIAENTSAKEKIKQIFAALENETRKFDLYKKAEEDKIKKTRELFKREILEASEEIDRLHTTREDIVASIKNLGIEFANIDKDVANRTKQLNELSGELDKQEKLYHAEIHKLESKLDSILYNIAVEEQNLDNIRKQIKESKGRDESRVEEINEREETIRILSNRLRKRFKELYPNVEVKI